MSEKSELDCPSCGYVSSSINDEIERLREQLVQAKALIQFIEDETTRYAEMYGRNSDGRNTFVILRDLIAARSAALTDDLHKDTTDPLHDSRNPNFGRSGGLRQT